MSTSVLVLENRRSGVIARGASYLTLTKPKIAVLELLAVVAAACVASSGLPTQLDVLLHALLGTALVAGSASALNQWLEQEADGRMARTADRPLPAGQLTSSEVAWFGGFTMLAGTVYLACLVNVQTAAVGVLTWFLYVWVYTPLKTRSSANTFVGAIAGAGPVLMGWTAMQTGAATREGLVLATTLFLIVFLWQFPHFMAIAWIYRKEYAAIGAKMLPVVEPTGRLAGIQAVMTAALLVPVSLYPSVVMKTGPVYFSVVLVLSLAQLLFSIQFLIRPSDRSARHLLRMSLVYLPILLGLLVASPFVFPWI